MQQPSKAPIYDLLQKLLGSWETRAQLNNNYEKMAEALESAYKRGVEDGWKSSQASQQSPSQSGPISST